MRASVDVTALKRPRVPDIRGSMLRHANVNALDLGHNAHMDRCTMTLHVSANVHAGEHVITCRCMMTISVNVAANKSKPVQVGSDSTLTLVSANVQESKNAPFRMLSTQFPANVDALTKNTNALIRIKSLTLTHAVAVVCQFPALDSNTRIQRHASANVLMPDAHVPTIFSTLTQTRVNVSALKPRDIARETRDLMIVSVLAAASMLTKSVPKVNSLMT